MQAVCLDADWRPKPEYDLSAAERETKAADDGSAVWHRPELDLVERERPEPAADEVLIRVAYAGICGSDLAMAGAREDGYMHYPAPARLPLVTGHEFSGRVAETGDDVDRFAPGDLVTAEVTDYCGVCDMCRQGYRGHCENARMLGFTIPGAHAEYVTVPERICWDVSPLRNAYDDGTELLKAAATIEPSSISYYGIFERADGVTPGDYYVFHGAGPIGLTGMNVARAAGAGRVIALEPADERRAIAEDLGFEHVYDPVATDAVAAIEDATGGEGADVHVEASAAVEQTYPVIGEGLAEGANVVHISNAGTPAPVETRQFQSSFAQIYGTETNGMRAYRGVIRLMAAGHLDNLPLVTAEFDLADATEAFDRAAERVDGKVLIDVAPEA